MPAIPTLRVKKCRQTAKLTLLMVGRTGRQPQHIGTALTAIATDFVVSELGLPYLLCIAPQQPKQFRGFPMTGE
jgi:hypothetical protein